MFNRHPRLILTAHSRSCATTIITITTIIIAITGGTGRFDGATGNGTATGEVNLVTGATPHQLEGSISTVGSN